MDANGNYELVDLIAIRQAMASGALIVHYSDKMIRYQSMSDLMKQEAVMAASLINRGLLAAPSNRGSATVATFYRD